MTVMIQTLHKVTINDIAITARDPGLCDIVLPVPPNSLQSNPLQGAAALPQSAALLPSATASSENPLSQSIEGKL